MNIYWCEELYDNYGMFVVAKTPSKAKYLYSQEADCKYTDVRYHCVVKDADVYKEETIPDTKDIVLQCHGLHYLDEYGQPIKNHDCVDTTLVTVRPVITACNVCKCYLFDYNSDFVYCPYCGSFIKDKGEKFDGSMAGKS